MSTTSTNGGDTVAQLHEEILNFERQRVADKVARYKVVIRVGTRSTIAGILLHVLQMIGALSQSVCILVLELSSTLGMGAAIVVFALTPGFNYDDFFYRRPVLRRFIWLMTLLQSVRVFLQPFEGAFATDPGPANVGLGLAVCVACAGLFSFPKGPGTTLCCPSMTALTSGWCVCFRAGQVLFCLLQGVGCPAFDVANAIGIPTSFALTVLGARLLRHRWECGETENQASGALWPVNRGVFWLSYNHLVSGREIVSGLLIHSVPACMSYDTRPWQSAFLYGVSFLIPHFVLLASGRRELHRWLIHRISANFEYGDKLVGFACRIAATSIFLMVWRTIYMTMGATLFSYIQGALAALLFSSGVVVMSTISPDDLNLDSVMEERPVLATCLGVSVSAYCGLIAIETGVMLYVVPALIMTHGAIASRSCRRTRRCNCPKPVDSACMAWTFKLLADAFWMRGAWPGCLAIAGASFHGGIVAVLGCVLLGLRTLHVWSGGLRGAQPTVCLFLCMYASQALAAAEQIGRGSLIWYGCKSSPGLESDNASAAAAIVVGMADIIPILLMVIVGRRQLFSFTARRFDRDPMRARRDGAFLASLLDGASRVQVGDEFWIHHGREDDKYPEQDAKRNWDRGAVVRVGADTFVVRTYPPVSALKDAAVLQRSSSSLSTRLSGAAVYHTMPMAGRELTVENMLAFAQQELRCIDWRNISRELMAGSCSDDLEFEPHSLSRPVRKGEVIDYFMSHSWHDDADAKWAKLQQVALKFQYTKRRSPTFWLDKVCIDQRHISDGLKVLPVNVMACRKVLVLCGETYPARLWCIWELCVVFSFASQDRALKRIEFEVLGDGGGYGTLERLRSFQARNARCYDPNEQARLFQVINTIGANLFDAQVRKLAEAIELKWQGNAGKADTRSGSFSLQNRTTSQAKSSWRSETSIFCSSQPTGSARSELSIMTVKADMIGSAESTNCSAHFEDEESAEEASI
eukprot:TRINITY_DN4210_c0_g4_i1.p1 TRINITY_DN4210_c0_g4~~TRINITY_DN4210_c0_g4_i1.p1  ORF type:complete len:978 (+),score=45.26 TRINITY_DN4210_c0_g4_i1:128-3061(+)